MTASRTRGFTAAAPRPNLVPLPQQLEPLDRAIRWPGEPVVICAEEDTPMIRAGIGELVSIPLKDITREDSDWLVSLHVNFPEIPDCGLLTADPYVIGNTDPVEVRRKIR